MSKHFLWAFFALVSFFVAACGEKETVIDVQSIAISQPSAEMEIGETLTLKATVSPSNASYDGLNWTSTNPKVASVSTSGLVTALSEGNTTITAMAGGKTASCAITVVKGFVAVTSISLDKTSLEMVEGESATLVATVLPSDATNKTVTWTSSSEAVTTVKDGTVTAFKEGEATISAEIEDKTATCKIIVHKKVQNSVIYYKSYGERIIDPYNLNAFDANIISNEYIDGIGVIAFDGPITTIGENAFRGQGDLIEVVIPDGVTSIGESAFQWCAHLTTISIPASVIRIGAYAFYQCQQLPSIELPRNLESIGAHSFEYCGSLVLELPEELSSIGDYAFQYCSALHDVHIPESVSVIGVGVFSACEISSFSGRFASADGLFLLDQKRIISVASQAAKGVITIPEGITVIGESSFKYSAGITGIVFPDGISIIEDFAFMGTNLSSITIPETVTRIGNSSFEHCEQMTSMTSLSIIPPLGGNRMFYATGEGPIYVCKESINAYKSAQYWNDYAERIQAIPE